MHIPSPKNSCLALVLALLLSVGLTACGQEKAPPDAAPAQTPASAEDIREDPFASCLDLSGLDQETLTLARQTIDQTCTDQEVVVHGKESIGDGYVLFLTLDMTVPEGMGLSEADLLDLLSTTSFLLAEGAVTDPAQAVEIPWVNRGLQGSLTEGNTLSCFLDFETQTCLTGREVSLLVTSETLHTTHILTWTVENEGEVRSADVTDESGQPVGTATLTPFTFNVQLDPGVESNVDTASAPLKILDGSGQAIDILPSFVTDPALMSAYFFRPLEPSTADTFQMGPYQGQFS